MNPSQFSSSSISSNETDGYFHQVMAAYDEEQDLLLRMYANNNILVSDILDDEDDDAQSKYRGAMSGHLVVNRPREEAAYNLWREYFAGRPIHGDEKFRRSFRMSKTLFHRIADAVKDHDMFFVQQCDGVGKLGLSTLQKITTAFRMLAYGVPADPLDDYLKIGESTAIRCLKKICRAVIEAKNVAGMYSGRKRSPSIILEAVADYDLWIWHAHFGLPGSNNDINVLEASQLFTNLAAGKSPPVNYTIMGKDYNVGYYLADGIYPKWSTLVQTIHDPQGRKIILFASKQESCRKDVERAFGVLQSRWVITKGPARFWDKHVLHDIMITCIIMHNMIIEDERDLSAPIREFNEAPALNVEMVVDEDARFRQFLDRHRQIRDKKAHYELRDVLIEHIWQQHGRT